MLPIKAFTPRDWDYFNGEETHFEPFNDGSQPLKLELVYLSDFVPTRGQFDLVADGQGLHLIHWVEGPVDFTKAFMPADPDQWDVYTAINYMEALQNLYKADTPAGIIMHFEFMANEGL